MECQWLFDRVHSGISGPSTTPTDLSIPSFHQMGNDLPRRNSILGLLTPVKRYNIHRLHSMYTRYYEGSVYYR